METKVVLLVRLFCGACGQVMTTETHAVDCGDTWRPVGMEIPVFANSHHLPRMILLGVMA